MSKGNLATNAQERIKLLTKDFSLLLQGQVVSLTGDIVYRIALGFWVLAVTGSTTLMGTLMAISAIPRILISPFAGVSVDRMDRKKLLIWMDVIRGLAVIFIGIAAIFGFIEIWMVFVVGIILSICSAYFDPAVGAVMPELVHPTKIMQANSFFGMLQSGTSIIGNPIGGVLFQVLGAPLLFLWNGISYIISAIAILFIKIPKVQRPAQEVTFMQDLKDGFKFIFKIGGLRNLIIVAAFLNFFATMALTLFTPLFNNDPTLGAGKFGIATAALSAGLMLSMVLVSALPIPANKRATVFILGIFTNSITFALTPFVSFAVMAVLIFIAGFANGLCNVFINATMQMAVPAHMRGKVFAMLSTLLGGIAPIAMALSGVLGDVLPIKMVISGSFILNIVLSMFFMLLPSFKRFINYDPATQKLEEIM